MISNQVKLGLLKPSDAERLALLADNKKISDNLRDIFPHPYTLEDAKWFIDFARNKSEDHRRTIEYKGELCGLIGLHAKEDVYANNMEIGYWLGESFWGQGIMTEAIRQITTIGFNELACHRIYAGVFSYNEGSKRALVKNDFRLEGVFKESIYKNGKYWDEYRYALLKEDVK